MGDLLPERYKSLRKLGEGGTGIVMLAYDTAVGRNVAIKIINLGQARNKGERDCLLECVKRDKIPAGLSHASLVTVFNAWWRGDVAYIEMEYVDGPTLEDLLIEEQLSIDRAMTILKDVATCLDYVHSKGIVHRDIKPSNIMLTLGGVVKICDFGVAKSMVSSTVSNVWKGTGPYMAPEQFKIGVPPVVQTDQWALGIIACRILTGRLPFEAPDWSVLVNMIINESPVNSGGKKLRQNVESVIGRALSKTPSMRFETCEEFVNRLAAALSGLDPWVNPADGLTYVWIPEGDFNMGSNDGAHDEKPVHAVSIKGFWISETPVTQTAYEKVMGGANPSQFRGSVNTN